MLELLLCSMPTILPDYLYRRYVQGKWIGKEITLFPARCFEISVMIDDWPYPVHERHQEPILIMLDKRVPPLPFSGKSIELRDPGTVS